MKTVLFVEPELRTDKLGFMYLATVLMLRGHQVFVEQCKYYSILDAAISLHNPNFLAYSVTSGNHEWYLKTNKEAKKRWPYLTSIMGGPHFTFYPEDGDDDGAAAEAATAVAEAAARARATARRPGEGPMSLRPLAPSVVVVVGAEGGGKRSAE